VPLVMLPLLQVIAARGLLSTAINIRDATLQKQTCLHEAQQTIASHLTSGSYYLLLRKIVYTTKLSLPPRCHTPRDSSLKIFP
jgi:hypothetical protein